MAKNNFAVVAIIVAMTMMSSAFFMAMADDSSASESVTVTDGVGNTFTFDVPPEKMVTLGKGFTATAIHMGLLDKIVVCDKYSKTDTDKLFDPLREKIDSGSIRANGSTYSTGIDDVVADIAAITDGKLFDKEKDVVFLTGTVANMTKLKETLVEYGYKNILCWENATDYDKIIDFVSTMSMVMFGEDTDLVRQMRNVVDYISHTLDTKADFVKREAFYVTLLSGNMCVGNTGSLANSMIIAAGGNSVTVDNSIDMATYVTNLTALVEKYGDDVVIFVDNQIASNSDKMDELRNQVGNDVLLVPLKPLWNNFSSDSMDGVWAMACAMYPEYFEGEVPAAPPATEDNTVVYAIAGILGVAVIGVVAFFFVRK
ncbi:MAG: hypothetical protein ACI4Q9_04670 [Candidatus Methanomethylophilaceae archaeon]